MDVLQPMRDEITSLSTQMHNIEEPKMGFANLDMSMTRAYISTYIYVSHFIYMQYIFTIWYRHLSIRITSCHAYLPRVITIKGFHKPMTVDRPRPHQTQILIETCPYLKQDLGLWSLWMFSPNLKSFRHVPMWKNLPPNFPANSAIRNAQYEQHNQGEFEMFDPQLHSSAGQLGMLS